MARPWPFILFKEISMKRNHLISNFLNETRESQINFVFVSLVQSIHRAGRRMNENPRTKIPRRKRKSLAQVLIIKLIRWDSVLHQIAISAIIFIVSLVCMCEMVMMMWICVCVWYALATQLNKWGKHTWLTSSEWRKKTTLLGFSSHPIHIHLRVSVSVCHTKWFSTLLFGNGWVFSSQEINTCIRKPIWFRLSLCMNRNYFV